MKGQERKTGRYDASGLIEAQFEPGSRRRVLRNLLRIKSKREMDRIEARAQVHALLKLTKAYGSQHRFTSADMCQIHRIWLGDIYAWAGSYRQVNLTKDKFTFCRRESDSAPHEGI